MSPAKPYVSGPGYAPPGAKKCLSSVAQTCNQLSLFLKDKGLKDVHFGINSSSKFDDPSSVPTKTTVDLLSNMENQHYLAGQNTYDVEAVAASESNKSKQMTIFYNGQVMVVDDISEDTAKEVMLAAADYDNNNSSATSSKAKAKAAAAIENSGSNQRRQIIDVQLQANGLDLPIARRASLHKFLAKRRDRATVRPEPYQLHHPSGSHHHDKNNNDHKFDLNL